MLRRVLRLVVLVVFLPLLVTAGFQPGDNLKNARLPSPAAGTTLIAGQTHRIVWEGVEIIKRTINGENRDHGKNVRLYLMTEDDSGKNEYGYDLAGAPGTNMPLLLEQLENDPGGDNFYDWTVPEVMAVNAVIGLESSDFQFGLFQGSIQKKGPPANETRRIILSEPFNITIQVNNTSPYFIAPTNGEQVFAGGNFTVEWENMNQYSAVVVRLGALINPPNLLLFANSITFITSETGVDGALNSTTWQVASSLSRQTTFLTYPIALVAYNASDPLSLLARSDEFFIPVLRVVPVFTETPMLVAGVSSAELTVTAGGFVGLIEARLLRKGTSEVVHTQPNITYEYNVQFTFSYTPPALLTEGSYLLQLRSEIYTTRLVSDFYELRVSTPLNLTLVCAGGDAEGILRRGAMCTASWTEPQFNATVRLELQSALGGALRESLGLDAIETVLTLADNLSVRNFTFIVPLDATLGDDYAFAVVSDDARRIGDRTPTTLQVVSTTYANSSVPRNGADTQCAAGSTVDSVTGTCVCADGRYGSDCAGTTDDAVAGFVLTVFARVYALTQSAIVTQSASSETTCAEACVQDAACVGFNFGLPWTDYNNTCELLVAERNSTQSNGTVAWHYFERIPCDDANCQFCSSTEPGACLSCDESTVLSEGNCASVCPAGTQRRADANVCDVCAEGTFAAAANSSCVSVLAACASPTPLELVAPTPSTDRFCVPSALPVGFGSATLGHLLDSPQLAVDSAETTQELALLLQSAGGATGTTGALTATLGSTQAALELAVPALASVRTRAVLLYDIVPDVYPDSPALAVLLEAFDALGGVPTSTTLTARLRAINGSADGSTADATCSTGSTGRCVAVVTTPALWFGSDTAQSFAVEHSRAAFEGGGFASVIATMLSAQPRRAAVPDTSVVMRVPQAVLRPGDETSVTVHADAGGSSPINSWTLAVRVGEGLTVTDVHALPEDWSFQVAGEGTEFAVISAIRAQGADAPLVPEALATFTVALNASWPGSAPDSLFLNLTVVDFFDADGLEPLKGETRPTIVDLDGVRTTADAASLLAAPHSVTALSLRPARGQLVNTAVLTGAAVELPLQLAAYHATGDVASADTLAALGSTCSSLAPNTLTASADCATLTLDGSETTGNVSAMVLATAVGGGASGADLVAAAVVGVWFPSGAVRLVANDTMLQAVSGWTNSTGALLYQHTPLHVLVDFQRGDAVAANVNMAGALLAAGVVTLSGNGTATLISDATAAYGSAVVLVGQNPGTVLAGLNLPAYSNVEPLTITVSATSVRAVGIQGATVASLAASLGAAQGSAEQAALGPRTASASYTSRLAAEFARATIAARVWFSDGTSMPLPVAATASDATPAATLALAPDATTVRLVGTDTVEAIASGVEDALVLTWRPAGGGDAIATGAVSVDVALPPPTSVELIVAGAGRVTRQGDPAARYEPVAQSITVRLVFADGRRQDVTTDMRTQLSIAAGAERVQVAAGGTTGQQVVAVAGNAAGGSARLAVSFMHVNLTSETDVLLVLAQNLVAVLRPLPAYPGSTTTSVTTLGRLGASTVYEAATLQATLLLTDSTTHDASADVSASATPSNVVQLSGGAGSGAIEVTRLADGDFGTANIAATLDSVLAVTLAVEVLDVSVAIASIEDVTFPAAYTGLPGAPAALTAGVVFTNGRHYPRTALFPVANGGPVVAGLLGFAVTDATAVAMDSVSGVASLLANSADTALAVVTALPSGPNGTAPFAANLEPSMGDVDLGALTGLPVPYAATMDVPVRVNLGSATIENVALELLVTYDPTRLRLLAVTLTTAYSSIFAANTDTPGEVRLGGATQEPLAGVQPVAVLQFEALVDGLAAVGGRTLTLADDNDMFLVPSNTSFVAGAVAVSVPPLERRRRSVGAAAAAAVVSVGSVPTDANLMQGARPGLVWSASSSPPSPRLPRSSRSSPRTSRVRRACAVAPTGDTNGDCSFNGLDVSFQLRYVTRQLQDPSDPLVTGVTADQLASLDIDRSGRINPQDADYLNKVFFDLFNFVADVAAVDVAASDDCLFSVAVTLAARAGEALDPATAFVWVLLQPLNDSSAVLADELASSIFETGSVLNTTGSGTAAGEGVLLATEHTGAGVYEVRLASTLSSARYGVSVVQGTVSAASGLPGPPRVSPLLAPTVSPQAVPGLQRWTAMIGSDAVDVVTGGYTPLLATVGPAEMTLACRLGKLCNFSSQYELEPAALASDAVCVALTECTAEQYELTAPTTSTDRVCANATVCTAELEYEVTPLNETADRVCETATVCTPGLEYETAPLLATADRECNATTQCLDGAEYELRPPNTTADRVCETLTVCGALQWEELAPNATRDRSCANLTVCTADVEFEAEAPTLTSDRVCTLLTVCNKTTEYEVFAGNASSDRVCEPDRCLLDNPCLFNATCTPLPDNDANCTCPPDVVICDERLIVTVKESDDTGDLDAGAIVGGVVGGLLLLLLLVLLVMSLRRRRKNLKGTPPSGAEREDKDKVYGSPLYTSPMEMEMQAMDTQGFSRKASFYRSVAALPDDERDAALAKLEAGEQEAVGRYRRNGNHRLSLRTAEDLDRFKPLTLQGSEMVTDLDAVESRLNPAYEGLGGNVVESRLNPAYEGVAGDGKHIYEAVAGRPPLMKTPSNQSEPGYTAIRSLPKLNEEEPAYMQILGPDGKSGTRIVYLQDEGVYYDLDTEDFYMTVDSQRRHANAAGDEDDVSVDEALYTVVLPKAQRTAQRARRGGLQRGKTVSEDPAAHYDAPLRPRDLNASQYDDVGGDGGGATSQYEPLSPAGSSTSPVFALGRGSHGQYMDPAPERPAHAPAYTDVKPRPDVKPAYMDVKPRPDVKPAYMDVKPRPDGAPQYASPQRWSDGDYAEVRPGDHYDPPARPGAGANHYDAPAQPHNLGLYGDALDLRQGQPGGSHYAAVPAARSGAAANYAAVPAAGAGSETLYAAVPAGGTNRTGNSEALYATVPVGSVPPANAETLPLVRMEKSRLRANAGYASLLETAQRAATLYDNAHAAPHGAVYDELPAGQPASRIGSRPSGQSADYIDIVSGRPSLVRSVSQQGEQEDAEEDGIAPIPRNPLTSSSASGAPRPDLRKQDSSTSQTSTV